MNQIHSNFSRRISDFPRGTPARYDIIGDVHGCAHTLEKLLCQMGYKHTENGYCHPERKTIFVGDIVDRGPRIRETLNIVYDMCHSGQAQCVMGNHELYAIAYFTPLLDGEGCLNGKNGDSQYVREHNSHHHRLIAETLEQYTDHPVEWAKMLKWFQTLPLVIENEHLRVVHACWDEALISQLQQRFEDCVIDEAFIQESANPSSFAAKALARLTRGTSMSLPEGVVIKGGDGIHRTRFRTRFWSKNPQRYGDVVFQPDPLPNNLADEKLSHAEYERLIQYGEQEKPVFIGHYWLQGQPKCLRSNVACLDYSAVKYGKLVAYRFDGESTLADEKFQWVEVIR